MKILSKQQQYLAKLRSISWHKKWLLARVFAVLTAYKALLFFFPLSRFMTLERTLALPKIVLSEATINEVIWAIHLVSSKIPMGFTCLVQALSAKWLLKNQPNVRVRIGVHKSPTSGFSAHAWIDYQNKTILGEQTNGQQFEPILEWN